MDISNITSWTQEQISHWLTTFRLSPEVVQNLLQKGLHGENITYISHNFLIRNSVSEATSDAIINALVLHGVRVPMTEAPTLTPVPVPQETNRVKFIRLLRASGENNIDETIITKIEVNFIERLAVSVPDAAREVYEMVKNLPGTTTKTIIKEEQGISVNGLWNLHTSKIILSAVDKTGRPLLLKTLVRGNDENAVNALSLSKLEVDIHQNIPLVPSTIVNAKLPAGVLRSRTEYKCLIMPHYSTTVNLMPQQNHFALHKGGLRMIEAVEYIHNHNFVHMDIKPQNIMVDITGNWFLGDFGSCVAKEGQITSYTGAYLYKNFGSVAKLELDWFMLLATLIHLSDKDNKSFVKNDCADLTTIYLALEEISGDFGQLLKDIARRCKLQDIFANSGNKHDIASLII